MTRLYASALLLLGFTLGVLFVLWSGIGHAQSPEVAAAIHQAAVRHGVSEAWMRKIAYCESRFQPWVTSRGGHAGLYQYAWRTWQWMSWQAGQGGTSPYDPWAAAEVTAWALSRGYAAHWSCR